MEEIVAEYKETRKNLLDFYYRLIGGVGVVVLFLTTNFAQKFELFTLLGLPICLLSYGMYKNLEFEYVRAKKRYLWFLVEVERAKYPKNFNLEVVGDIAIKFLILLYITMVAVKLIGDMVIEYM